jgi:D-alanyl-D-alanine carboxypeptidase/D-alanyl-D-alanine-endopeptidase (penicillin-binding protein 4)
MNVLPRRSASYALLLVLALALASVAAASPSSEAGVGPAVARILARPELDGAGVSLLAVDLETGRVLASRAPDALRLPASNLKLLTAAAALRGLGGGWRWRTRLLAEGDALVLVGAGDPTLSAEGLRTLARSAIPARRLVLDLDAISNLPYGPGWAWDDEGQDYSPPLGALGVDENLVAVEFLPSLAVGAPIRVMAPTTLAFEGKATTGRADAVDTFEWRRLEGKNRVRVEGVLPMGRPRLEHIAVADGATYAAEIFTQALAQPLVVASPAEGGGPSSGAGPAARELGAIESPPLAIALVHMLKTSDNYYAEQILRTLGRAREGRPADSGLEEEAALLEPLGLRPGSWRQVDGSGLSRMDLVRASQLVTVLRAMAGTPEFVTALPVAGVDGTLASRFRGSPLQGRLRAKTGTMTGVSSLSGYLCDPAGRPRVAFSLLIDHHLGSTRVIKGLEDEIMEALLIRPAGRCSPPRRASR